MGFGRAASALGVGKVLGEISGERATEAAVLNNFGAYSSVASCSAGVEVKGNEVIVVGMSEKWSGPLGIAHGVLADALDVDGVRRALAGLGLASSTWSPPPLSACSPCQRTSRSCLTSPTKSRS